MSRQQAFLEWQPTLTSCPPLLPDKKGQRNTFFESVLVAHQLLKKSPTVPQFLEEMIRWTSRSPQKSDFYKQNILHSYYLVGLIPYTKLKQPADYRLVSELPITTVKPNTQQLGRLRVYCLACFNKRLKYSEQFWLSAARLQPFTQNQLLDEVSNLGIKYKELTRRTKIMLNLGALQESQHSYSFTPLGEKILSTSEHTIQYQQTNEITQVKEESTPYNLDGFDFIDLW